jgi:hypothetical protein
MMKRFMKVQLLLLSCILLSNAAHSQRKIVRDGSFYCSWGYNAEWYTNSDIHVSQPSQNNDFTYLNVTAHDHKGWDNNLLHKDLTIPQYSYRLGYFFDEKQKWAFEINFDHTKYNVSYGQTMRMKGKIGGRDVDTLVHADERILLWMLNNGANFLQFNMVRKLQIFDVFKSRLTFDALVKAGVGPVIPHVENTILGHDNNPNFQFGGWNADLDLSFKMTFFKHVFLEYQSKVVYGRYFGLKVYEGRADQHFGCFEMVLALGATFKL